ncbi:hypothetical protein [Glycomyces paridis]|uniref:Uncharacterized protein n=1 Tax=Glycomyces paridis TaxID=2126555 RepID=A0A4S8NXK1_9ACTN|nr:hypothetical protein [Glycomyces paridis]THV21685.1 hypothetical protein E9998_24705 [Glycomyces paridis]
MHIEPLEPARTEPRITVEAAPAEADGGVGARSAREGRPTRSLCPHRIRLRDLRAGPVAVFAVAAPLVFAAMAVAAATLLIAAVLGALGVDRSEPAMLVAAVFLAALAAQFALGAAACVRAWRRLHRPGVLGCVLTTVAAGVFPLIVGVVAAGNGWAWLTLVVVPPLATMTVLWYLRSATLDRATCVQYPWPPPRLQSLLKPRPPAAQEERSPYFA